MNAQPEQETVTEGARLSAIGLVAVHAVALLILFFVPVFICPTVVDHYNRIGVPETPLFFRAHLISDYFAAYTPIWLAAGAVYLFFLYRRSRAGSRWLPAASNFALLSIALFGMVYTAWLISPMPFPAPNAPIAVDADTILQTEVTIAQAGG